MDRRKRIPTAMTPVLASIVLVVVAAASGCQRREEVQSNRGATRLRQAVLPTRPSTGASAASRPRGSGVAKPSRSLADARRAAEAANREAKRRYGLEPFSADDFHRAGDKSRVVFIAWIGAGYNDIQAEVRFSGDRLSEVVLTVLTNRIMTPNILREEKTVREQTVIVREVKIEPEGKKGP